MAVSIEKQIMCVHEQDNIRTLKITTFKIKIFFYSIRIKPTKTNISKTVDAILYNYVILFYIIIL